MAYLKMMIKNDSSISEVMAGLETLVPRLIRFCWSLTGDRSTAEDIAQAACLKAIEKADQYQAGTNLDRRVFRIAQSLWFNQLRSEKVRRGTDVVSADETDLRDKKPLPDTNIFHNEVLSAIMALPDHQRATVLLVYAEGYSYKEAAQTLDVPIGTVMSRLSAARCALSGLKESGKVPVGEKARVSTKRGVC